MRFYECPSAVLRNCAQFPAVDGRPAGGLDTSPERCTAVQLRLSTRSTCLAIHIVSCFAAFAYAVAHARAFGEAI